MDTEYETCVDGKIAFEDDGKTGCIDGVVSAHAGKSEPTKQATI